MNTQQLAEAFSGHRFADVYDALTDTVRWVMPGQATIEGRSAVISTCEDSLAQLNALQRVDFDRFVSVGGPRMAAVDTIGRYVSPDGSVSVVSSADIYEFDEQTKIVSITSYAVELEDGGD